LIVLLATATHPSIPSEYFPINLERCAENAPLDHDLFRQIKQTAWRSLPPIWASNAARQDKGGLLRDNADIPQ